MQHLSDKVLLHVAGYSWACNVYCLCLTCSRFHEPVPGTETPIATKMLREALTSGLSRVLLSCGLSLSAISFANLRSAEGVPGALVSGSTMVRAMLGLDWGRHDCPKSRHPDGAADADDHDDDGDDDDDEDDDDDFTGRARCSAPLDVDIFTTAAAAPAVRTQLVSHGHVFTGFGITYDDHGSGMLGHLAYSVVHHVEGYTQRPRDGDEASGGGGDDDDGGDVDSDDDYDDDGPFVYQRACAHGEPALVDAFCRIKGSRLPSEDGEELEPFGFRMSGEHAIRVLPGTPLPFDWNLRRKTSLDLVVSEAGIDDARRLLDSFDLLLCKASFDGAAFRIPDPHRSLAARSRLEPQRLALMEAFAEFAVAEEHSPRHNRPTAGFCCPPISDCEWRAIFATARTRDDSGGSLFAAAGVRWTAKLPAPRRRSPRASDAARAADEEDEAFAEEYGGGGTTTLFYHNFMARLFHRLRKYARRGVRVEAASSRQRRAFLALADRLRVLEIPGADIGVLGAHAGTPGRELLEAADRIVAESGVAAAGGGGGGGSIGGGGGGGGGGDGGARTSRAVQRLIAELGGNPSASVGVLPAALGPAACRGLVAHADAAFARAAAASGGSGAPPDSDFKVSLSPETLAALVGGDRSVALARALLPGRASSIQLRRCAAHGRCLKWHTDRSTRRTLRVALNAPSEYEGGRLVFATARGLLVPPHDAGTAHVHDAESVHGVSTLRSGTRYALFLLDKPRPDKPSLPRGS